MSEYQQVNKAGVTRDLTPEAVVIWGTDGLPMGSATNPLHVTSDSTTVTTATPDVVITGTIAVTDSIVAAPAGAGALVSGASTSGSLVSSPVTGGATAWDMQITSLTSGTLYFEGSLDSTNGTDGNWINLNAKQSGLNNATIVTSAVSNGVYRGNISGMKYFRVRSVGTLTGNPSIVIRLSFGVDALFLSAPLPAGLNTIGQVGGIGVFSSPGAITVTASSAYATGNLVGGKLSFTSAARSGISSGIIQSVIINSASAQSASTFDIVFFNSDPTGTTFTDKTAFSIASADLPKVLGIAHCTDVTTIGGSIALALNFGLPFVLAQGTTLYGAIIVRGTPTFTATSDVTARLSILQD